MKRRDAHSEEDTWELDNGDSGQFEEAVKDFDRAIELEPNNAHYWAERGRMKWKIDQTMRVINVAIGAPSEGPERLEEAARDYEKAFELEPDNDDYRGAHGELKTNISNMRNPR